MKSASILLALLCFLAGTSAAHEFNRNETESPFLTKITETAPRVASYHEHCPNCLGENYHFWCPQSQKCYFYEGDERNVLGKDCTDPANYLKYSTTVTPLVNQFHNDILLGCFTTYLPIEKSTNSTGNYTVGSVNDCAYTFDESTGEKKHGQPARIIVDDQYRK